MENFKNFCVCVAVVTASVFFVNSLGNVTIVNEEDRIEIQKITLQQGRKRDGD